MNVRVGQPVELKVTRRMNEDYVPPPPRPLAPFEGQGHRLGSVVPSISDSSAQPSGKYLASLRNKSPFRDISYYFSVPGAFPSATASSASREDSTGMKFQVDQSLPTTSVQVRLADGTR